MSKAKEEYEKWLYERGSFCQPVENYIKELESIMIIKTKKYVMDGSGGVNSSNFAVNKDEISSIQFDLDYGFRPFTGLSLLIMNNGNKHYTSLTEKDF